MNNLVIRSTSILLCLLATALQAGQSEKCTATAGECEREIRKMLTGRSWLGLEISSVPRVGLFIKRVVPDSPALRAGFQEGDRVLAINDKWVTNTNVRDLKQLIADSKTPRLSILISRNGAFKRIDVRLEAYTKDQIDKIIAAHIARGHTADGSQPPP